METEKAKELFLIEKETPAEFTYRAADRLINGTPIKFIWDYRATINGEFMVNMIKHRYLTLWERVITELTEVNTENFPPENQISSIQIKYYELMKWIFEALQSINTGNFDFQMGLKLLDEELKKAMPDSGNSLKDRMNEMAENYIMEDVETLLARCSSELKQFKPALFRWNIRNVQDIEEINAVIIYRYHQMWNNELEKCFITEIKDVSEGVHECSMTLHQPEIMSTFYDLACLLAKGQGETYPEHTLFTPN